jgi:hypothetical protein
MIQREASDEQIVGDTHPLRQYASILLSIDDEVRRLFKGSASLGIKTDPVAGDKILRAAGTECMWQGHAFDESQPSCVG